MKFIEQGNEILQAFELQEQQMMYSEENFIYDYREKENRFYGILVTTALTLQGLAPLDESAGPLFVNELYKQGQIQRNIFGVLLAPSADL